MPLALQRLHVQQHEALMTTSHTSTASGAFRPAGLEQYDLEPGGLDEGSDNDDAGQGGLAIEDVMLDLARDRLSSRAAAYKVTRQDSYGLCCDNIQSHCGVTDS